MKIVMQVHYCCWKSIMSEQGIDPLVMDVELQFMGNSRQHAKDCPEKPVPRLPKQNRGTGIAESASRLDIGDGNPGFSM